MNNNNNNNNNNTNITTTSVNRLGAFVIDLDTGTIVGTNVVFVNEADLTAEELEAVEDGDVSDSWVFDLGQKYGKALYTVEDA